ncbi:hypothetical protein ABIG06_004677 [Bradyrhizobium sp. USDA 326]
MRALSYQAPPCAPPSCSTSSAPPTAFLGPTATFDFKDEAHGEMLVMPDDVGDTLGTIAARDAIADILQAE